jgi:HlyD family secretion protein
MKEAEPLYTLVPPPLEAEVLVEGLDVGHVKTGSLTRLKLEAWPFQKHGMLTGQLRTLSEDTFNPDPKKDGKARAHYKARIEITSTKLRDVPPTFSCQTTDETGPVRFVIRFPCTLERNGGDS